jgi:methionine biosynthesis protein MetW
MIPKDWHNLTAPLRPHLQPPARRRSDAAGSDPSPPSSNLHPPSSPPPRWQDALIEQIIPDGSSVLDLGCGRGQLLARLVARKHVRGQGIEIDPDMVFESVARGVPVFMTDLDTGLRGFADHSFDYVVLEETLQTLRRPVDVLDEMLRVGRVGIVSFPNFGHWRVRAELAATGRMPKSPSLPHDWFDTPNIHLCTLADFLAWTESHRVAVRAGHVLADTAVRPLRPDDDLAAEEVLLVVERDPSRT